MKAWITKYALTTGIQEVDGEIFGRKAIRYPCPPRGVSYAHGTDWHWTHEDALARAELMRDRKILSMKKRIAELERMEFI